MSPIHFVLIALLSAQIFAAPASAQDKDDKLKAAGPELYHASQLIFADGQKAKQSLYWIEARDNVDMAAHLITAMRYSRLRRGDIMVTLEKLTGHTPRENTWFDWAIWQEQNPDITPHESYLDFKSLVFYALDPAFVRFFRPDMEFDIRAEEIVWGGVRVDGIPALDNPELVAADHAKASYLKDDDEVFGVAINGDIRAYPLRIMGWHEMFNDVVGGVPVSQAYCTLCGAGILFEGDYAKDHPEIAEKYGLDAPFTFGSSGFLYRSNKLMYDRNTDSLWNQFTGEPVSGPLRGSGIKLGLRPVVITSWGAWKKANPGTKVLTLNTGYSRDYGSGVVYKEYFASPQLMFPAHLGAREQLSEKDQIFGVRVKGGAKAWPIGAFADGRVINDRAGLVNLVLIGDDKTRSVRGYERGDLIFTMKDDNTLIDDKGGQWTVSEEYLSTSDGRRFKRVPGHVAYWFAWAGYLGEDSELFSENAQ